MGDSGINECSMALIPWEAGGKWGSETRNSDYYHKHNCKDSYKGGQTLYSRSIFPTLILS